ncbi:MAG: MBL fold metallo-hydrolase [Bacteroidales bacterium]|nr:MBL fold metallo-hydrolase [Bacteroidales bacterium]
MSQLKIILIDVAWGDSIFLEAKYGNNRESYALIDSNDTANYKSSLIFLKKYFQRKFGSSRIDKPLFEWIMLSHAHLDHGQGLKEIMRTFGAKKFYYPKSIENSSLAHLQQYANRSGIEHQHLDDNRAFPDFGDARVKVLWPRYNEAPSDNENNNSIVLAISQSNKTCMLTGDSEEEVWNEIKNKIPANTVFFKVPHHGSRNGSLDAAGHGTWTTNCPHTALLGISTHNRPFNHPHQEVLNEFASQHYEYVRTDDNYHLEVVLDDNPLHPKYSRQM